MNLGIEILLLCALVPVLIWAVARFHLQGEDLSAFDSPAGERFAAERVAAADPGTPVALIHQGLARTMAEMSAQPHRQRQATMRRLMDDQFADRVLDVVTSPIDAAGVPCQWVLAPGADSRCRTLYIHGGAFFAGSPKSHRTLTSRFSELTGGAVLAIDYRLIPENPRHAGIDDCRSVYRWMLENGPDGAEPAQTVFVAGDSAGGNLALSLVAWVRDQGLRAPDAAVALSPITDATLGSPSLKAHVGSDAMLGPIFGALIRVPRPLLLWGAWIRDRINPRDPVVSPALGDLSGLPPVLVQASQTEMLRDDARRWVNKARAAGSPARLQLWDGMLHVWQIFNPELPEANAALDEIGRFLAEAAGRSGPVQRNQINVISTNSGTSTAPLQAM